MRCDRMPDARRPDWRQWLNLWGTAGTALLAAAIVASPGETLERSISYRILADRLGETGFALVLLALGCLHVTAALVPGPARAVTLALACCGWLFLAGSFAGANPIGLSTALLLLTVLVTAGEAYDAARHGRLRPKVRAQSDDAC